MHESSSERSVVSSEQTERSTSRRPTIHDMSEESGQRAVGIVSRYLHKEQLIDGKLAITEAAAAGYLGLNSWQLRDLRREGKITYRRIVGNRVRYTLNDLNEYLERSIQPGT